jgi:hypothetical protein
MSTFHQQPTRLQIIQHRLGVVSIALLAMALVGSIVHDLGASPAHQSSASTAARQAV